MKVNFYITKNGILKRKQNTVYFIRKNEEGKIEKKILPIEKIYSIYAHGRISFSSGVISYLSKYNVPIHFFNKYGFYEASLIMVFLNKKIIDIFRDQNANIKSNS